MHNIKFDPSVETKYVFVIVATYIYNILKFVKHHVQNIVHHLHGVDRFPTLLGKKEYFKIVKT